MCRLAILALLIVALLSVHGQDIPPFMKRATPGQIESYKRMVQSNGHLKEAAFDAKIAAWAKQQGGKVLADYNDFQNFVKAQG
ncbi:hypothetical protein CAEBREN_09397 [Caenorhabditis brenneri]|uniref:OV-17 antigen n=1 Tax=Caenorhabditis brenneri TaxID=135651 RepID=B0ZBB0_CAEBE|nr:OV-17 antigen precursor [Caenorhabditis brenneri]EGT53712.1 hypothetical protein CAEBREN_09397 [Caenorhabditis brenneri]